MAYDTGSAVVHSLLQAYVIFLLFWIVAFEKVASTGHETFFLHFREAHLCHIFFVFINRLDRESRLVFWSDVRYGRLTTSGFLRVTVLLVLVVRTVTSFCSSRVPLSSSYLGPGVFYIVLGSPGLYSRYMSEKTSVNSYCSLLYYANLVDEVIFSSRSQQQAVRRVMMSVASSRQKYRRLGILLRLM